MGVLEESFIPIPAHCSTLSEPQINFRDVSGRRTGWGNPIGLGGSALTVSLGTPPGFSSSPNPCEGHPSSRSATMGVRITAGNESLMFVGIDVSHAHLDVAVRSGPESWQVEYEDTGINSFVARLQALAPELIVCEATGGYESALV